MPTSVTMPALGESVTEGTVTRWLKQEGDTVEVDEPLLEVSTDKVDTEIPSPAAGVLTKILVAEDETVDVGAELAVIGGDGDGSGDGGGQAAPPASADDAETPQTPDQQVEDAAPAPADETPAPQQQEEPPAAPADGGGGGGEGTPVTMPALGESVTEGTVTRWLKAVGDEITADEPLLEVSTDKVDTEIPAPVSGTLLEITVNEDETVDVGAQLAVIGSGSGGGSAPAPAAPAQEAPQQEAPQQEAPQQEAPAQEAPQQAPTEEKPQAAPEAKPAASETTQPGGDYGASGAQPAASPTSEPPPQVAPQAPAGQSSGGQQSSGGDGGSYVTPLVRRLAAERGVDLSSVTGSGVGGRIRKQDVLAAAEKASAPAAAAPAAPAAGGARTPAPAA
ncbi:MAG: E3 binding domain-containing protein, partial [Blastococcus sp.]|nr:E3 binding domain-containing protein [Blastococcus sp.]